MATTFTATLKSTCYDYSPVSQIIYSLLLYGLIDWIFESFPIRNRGWGLNGKEYVRSWGIVASVRVRTMRDGGQMTSSHTIRGKKNTDPSKGAEPRSEIFKILRRGLSPPSKIRLTSDISKIGLGGIAVRVHVYCLEGLRFESDSMP